MVGDIVNGTAIPCFYTQDGMIIGSSNGMHVDINGLKGPNAVGKDQFSFYIANEDKSGVTKGTVMPYGSIQYANYVGRSYEYWRKVNFNKIYTTEQWVLKNLTGKYLEQGKID